MKSELNVLSPSRIAARRTHRGCFRPLRLGVAAGISLLVLGASQSAFGQNVTFTGTSAAQWSGTANWSTGSVPTASQDVFVNSGVEARIGNTTSAVAKTITIGGAAGTSIVSLRQDAVNSLTVSGNITIAPGAGAGQLTLGTGVGQTATLTIGGGSGSILDGGGAGASRVAIFGNMGTLGLATVTVDELNINQNSSGSLTIGAGQTYTIGTARVGSATANVTDALTVNGTLIATTLNPGANSTNGTNDATVTLNTGALVRAVTIRRAGTQATTFTWNGGTIQNISGTNLTLDATAGTQTISLASAGTRTFDADSGRTITVASTTLLADKSGENGSLTKAGAGTLIFSGSNTYSGATTLSSGTLRLSHQNAIQNSTLTMNGGAVVFDSSVTGNAFTLGGLSAAASGAGFNVALQNNAGTPAAIALTVGGNNASTTYAGILSGAGSLTKVGSGVLTLSAANTFSGPTSVQAGRLLVNGTNASLGGTTVDAGALLGGSGRIDGLVTVSGTLSPGNSPGLLTLSQLVLTSTATTLMEIDGLARGSQYDGIDITTSGGLTYAGALSIAFGLGSAAPDNTTFDLFNFSGTPTGDFASVVSTGGVYAGTWQQVSSGTWSLQAGAQTLTLSTATGDVIIVPEPGTLAMLAGAAAAAGFALARRKQKQLDCGLA